MLAEYESGFEHELRGPEPQATVPVIKQVPERRYRLRVQTRELLGCGGCDLGALLVDASSELRFSQSASDRAFRHVSDSGGLGMRLSVRERLHHRVIALPGSAHRSAPQARGSLR